MSVGVWGNGRLRYTQSMPERNADRHVISKGV